MRVKNSQLLLIQSLDPDPDPHSIHNTVSKRRKNTESRELESDEEGRNFYDKNRV
jgi:hypothetical protein